MAIPQKVSGNWIWNDLEPSRAAEPFCATGSWKSCVSEALSQLYLIAVSHQHSEGQCFPQFFSNCFNLGFWCSTVAGLCWEHCPKWYLWNVFLRVSYFTSQDRKVEQDLQVVIPVRLHAAAYVSSIACFPLCQENPMSKWMFSFPTWSLRSWFAFQGREFAKFFSKLQASLSHFCH